MTREALLELAKKIGYWIDQVEGHETTFLQRPDGSVELNTIDNEYDPEPDDEEEDNNAAVHWGTFAEPGALLVDTGLTVKYKDEEIALVTINGIMMGANLYKAMAATLMGYNNW